MKNIIVALAFTADIAVGGCVKVSTTAPTDLPAYVRVMPGSEQKMVSNMGVTKTEMFTTSSSVDEVVAFYRAQAQADGLTEGAAQPSADPIAKQVRFADTASGRLLIVDAQPSVQEPGKTLVSLTYMPPAKAS